MNSRIVAVALGTAALAIPTAAAAHPGGGKGHDKHGAETKASHGKGHGKTRVKTVTFVFKGVFTAPGTVKVTSGNAHVRKGGYVGQDVAFDLAAAKLVVADTNADGAVDVADVKDGDTVLIQARVAKRTKYAAPAEGETTAPITARKLVDRTNAPTQDKPESETPPAA
jgi:hypothetical protein